MKLVVGHNLSLRILFILSVGLIISCNNVSTSGHGHDFPNESKVFKLRLIDSLGTVSFAVPIRYDTNFRWIHHSDCGKSCDEQKYRFQSKALPIIKENGFNWAHPKDSVERFTISHTLYFPFHDGDTGKNANRLTALKKRLTDQPGSPPILFDTIEKINGRYYYIVVMNKSASTQSKKIVAITTIKSNEITFSYELKTSKTDTIASNFISNSLELLRTIRIEKGV